MLWSCKMKDSERHQILKEFGSQLVFFPSYRQAYSLLLTAVDSTLDREIPTCGQLIGPSGSGKSALVKHFVNSFGAPYEELLEDGLYKRTPALVCVVPSPITVKGFAKELLLCLGHPSPRGDTVDLTNQLVAMISTLGIKVIVFDEFQRLLRKNAESAREATIDWVVALLSKINICIILCGTDDFTELMQPRASKPFARRYPYIAKLNHLDYSESYESEYLTLLHHLDEKLYRLTTLSNGAHLTDHNIFIPLYVATRGNLEYLRQIIHGAINICLIKQSKNISLNEFRQSTEQLWLPDSLCQEENPFTLSLNRCASLIARYSNE